MARDVRSSEKSQVCLYTCLCVFSDRADERLSGAADRQILEILINNYYSDKDNLRSRVENHADAKCALSTLFYGWRRSTRPSPATLRAYLLFFLYRARRVLTKVSVEEAETLKWMEEEYVEESGGNSTGQNEEIVERCRRRRGGERERGRGKEEEEVVETTSKLR